MVAGTQEIKILSNQLRYGNKKQKAALLRWVNQKRFSGRKPTPEELTKECLRKKSPLYGLMKTTTNEAAEQYWRQTAQDIIRHIDMVVINVRTEERITRPIRAYVHVKIAEQGRIPEENYIPNSRTMKREIKLTVLEMARKDLMAWMDRFGRYASVYKEFGAVIDVYKELQEKLNEVGK